MSIYNTKPLPTGAVTSRAKTANPEEIPKLVKVIFKPTLYELEWTLEAVGQDNSTYNDAIVPIDNLSYKPSNGWENESPYGFYNVQTNGSSALGGENRKLAQKCVYKWYRIKNCLLTDALPVPQDYIDRGAPNTIAPSRELALPIFDRLNEINESESTDEKIVYKKAQVYGTAYTGGMAGQSNSAEISVPFTLDLDRGIVMFERPVYIIDNNQGNYTSASLTLKCTCNLRPTSSMPFMREARDFNVGGPYGEHVIRSDDRGEATPNGNDVTDLNSNFEDLDILAASEAASKIDSFVNQTSETATYIGVINPPVNGGYQQVQWNITQSGSETILGINNEFDAIVAGEAVRRRRRKSRATEIAEEISKSLIIGGAMSVI